MIVLSSGLLLFYCAFKRIVDALEKAIQRLLISLR